IPALASALLVAVLVGPLAAFKAGGTPEKNRLCLFCRLCRRSFGGCSLFRLAFGLRRLSGNGCCLFGNLCPCWLRWLGNRSFHRFASLGSCRIFDSSHLGGCFHRCLSCRSLCSSLLPERCVKRLDLRCHFRSRLCFRTIAEALQGL